MSTNVSIRTLRFSRNNVDVEVVGTFAATVLSQMIKTIRVEGTRSTHILMTTRERSSYSKSHVETGSVETRQDVLIASWRYNLLVI